MRKTLTLILGVALFGILAAVVVASQGADDPAGTTGTATTTDDADRTTTTEDNPARQGVDDDSPAQGGVDISGPCDEAEHANDPRCAGQAPTTRRRPTRPPPRTAWTSPARVTRPSTPTTRAAPARRPATTAATTTAAATTAVDDNSGPRRATTPAPAARTRAAGTTTAAATAAVATAATAAVATTTDQPGAPARLPFRPMAGRRTILMVEDEESITEPLAEALEREGFDTQVAGTVGGGAASSADAQMPDLVLLDVMLPDGSGYDVCRAAPRSAPRCRSSCSPRAARRPTAIVGLELGADDYIVKPFSAREVVARIRAVLRRTGDARPPADDEAGPLEVGDVRLDPAAREATLDGEALELTRKEFELLELLMREAGTRGHARAAHRRGLGHELVRLDEDARRARVEPARKLGDDSAEPALHPHRPRRRLPLRRPPTELMSLRAAAARWRSPTCSCS